MFGCGTYGNSVLPSDGDRRWKLPTLSVCLLHRPHSCLYRACLQLGCSRCCRSSGWPRLCSTGDSWPSNCFLIWPCVGRCSYGRGRDGFNFVLKLLSSVTVKAVERPKFVRSRSWEGPTWPPLCDGWQRQGV